MSNDTRRSAIIDWMERHLGDDLTLTLSQRRMLEEIMRNQWLAETHGKPVKAKHQTHMLASRTGMSPSLTWVDEPFSSYVLVRSGQPVKEPVDYYKSASWVNNRKTLLKHIKTWETA